MPRIPTDTTSHAWSQLLWTRGGLSRTRSRHRPLEAAEAPKAPGIYQMWWEDAETWEQLPKKLTVRASPRIGDPVLTFSGLQMPIALTIGRSVNIYERIRQHLGSNRNNNRVLRRMLLLEPRLDEEELRELMLRSVFVEWTVVGSWPDRCRLERFGAATIMPLLDFEAEH